MKAKTPYITRCKEFDDTVTEIAQDRANAKLGTDTLIANILVCCLFLYSFISVLTK